MKKLINRYWTKPLFGRHLLWTTYIRVFCDGGQPRWNWCPKIARDYYHYSWKIWGFAVYLWGREIHFSFGKDVNGLYNHQIKSWAITDKQAQFAERNNKQCKKCSECPPKYEYTSNIPLWLIIAIHVAAGIAGWEFGRWIITRMP